MILLSCCFIITACGQLDSRIKKSDIYKECVRKNINDDFTWENVSHVRTNCIRYVKFEMKINGYVLPSDKPVDENY